MTDSDRLQRIESELDTLRQQVVALQTNDKVATVHRENVETRLGKIEANTSRIIWLVLGGLATAGLAFVVNGGLAP